MLSNEYSITHNRVSTVELASWGQILKRVNWPVSLSNPRNPSFNAKLQRATLGPLSLLIYSSDPVVANREGAPCQQGKGRIFSFNYINKGSITVTHNNRRTRLIKNDIVLVDNSIRSVIEFHKKTQALSVRIPEKLLSKYIDSPNIVVNQLISHTNPFNRVLKELFFCLWAYGEKGSYDDDCNIAIDMFLGLLASSFNVEKGPTCRQSTVNKSESLLQKIKLYLDDNLSDNNLKPELVASEFGISTRYLRKLFQLEGVNSMSDYLRYKRLEKCADALTDPSLRNMSITQIAYHWGFNNSSSFTRSFKSYFNVSPKQYRSNRY